MPYTVIIKKIEKNVPFEHREWKQLRDDETKDPSGNNESYGYVTYDSVQDVTTDVFEQTVEDLDMTEVIKAVNGLK